MQEDNFKIHAGGAALFIYVISFIMGCFLFLGSFYELFFSSESLTPKDIAGIILCPILGVLFMTNAFMLLKSNYIIISNNELRISIYSKETKNFLTKFDKANFKLNEIEYVTLTMPDSIVLNQYLVINAANSNPYIINFKPFSKKDFVKFVNELLTRGVNVINEDENILSLDE